MTHSFVTGILGSIAVGIGAGLEFGAGAGFGVGGTLVIFVALFAYLEGPAKQRGNNSK